MVADRRPFSRRRRAEEVARRLGDALVLQVDDAPAPSTREVSGRRYFVVRAGEATTYWPVEDSLDERVFELREDEFGNAYGVQVSGPPERAADGDEDWRAFERKLSSLVSRSWIDRLD